MSSPLEEHYLRVLAHFFEQGRWGTLLETNVEQQSLSTEDRVYLLLRAAPYLTITKEKRKLQKSAFVMNARRFVPFA